MTLGDAPNRPAIDQKIETEIPSEVRRSIHDDAARREVVIRPEVPDGGPPCATVLMKIAHPKTNIRRTFLAKLCFDFMADIIAIELRFRQQVAAEALKNIPKRAKRVFLGSDRSRAPESPENNFNWQGGPQEPSHETRSY